MSIAHRVLRWATTGVLVFVLLVVPMSVLIFNALTGVSPVGFVAWALLLLLTLGPLAEWLRRRRKTPDGNG